MTNLEARMLRVLRQALPVVTEHCFVHPDNPQAIGWPAKQHAELVRREIEAVIQEATNGN